MRTWLVALALAVGTVGALEAKVRGMGYRPSAVDDEYLWSIERARVANGDPKTLALLGASRIQLAADMDELRRQLPDWTIAQLAIDGTSPVATLRDLAADESFRGVAVVAIHGWNMDRSNWHTQRRWVLTYHDPSPGQWLDRWLAARVQARLALLGAAGRRMLTGLVSEGQWPEAIYLQTHPDRSRDADYTLTDAAARRAAWVARFANESDRPRDAKRWVDDALGLDEFIEPIQRRGGEVVLLRMPTCGAYLAHMKALHPRATFWDAMAARTRAKTIHFEDHPGLRGFDCPDLTHLDQRDKPRFTRALVEVLRGLGVVQTPR